MHVSFDGNASVRYTQLISQINKELLICRPKYDGIFKFSKFFVEHMQYILTSLKGKLLDKDSFANIVVFRMMCDEKQYKKCSYEEFQTKLLEKLISSLENQKKECFQKDVDDLLKLTDLVYEAHIELSNREWSHLAKQYQKQLHSKRKLHILCYDKLKPDDYFVDLSESEKYIACMDMKTYYEYHNASYDIICRNRIKAYYDELESEYLKELLNL